ncbi:HAD family hydrolase [Histomonas meleagridis]|uniref:HAD family hydrolase n=1 Tax=Histomonas meleagridis TaxID=135588 RepID=UPI00355A8871|nr:HAD family hydrolase [Histomonas meleagridis]KAH0797769.1 HAD family hydrolase [Histomonas meleagridis]
MIIFSFLAIHYVTFDVYGTLLDMSSITDRIKEIAKENNVDPVNAANTYSSSEDEVMYGEEYADLDVKIQRALFWTDIYLNTNCFEKAYDRVIDAYNNLKPFPEVVEALTEIKNRGYTIAMMSNSMKAIMDNNRKALGDLFEIAYLADEVKNYKPRLEFFKYVHEKLDFDHNNHTHVAAGYWWDIFPAAEMKWPNKIWVNRGNMKSATIYDPQIEVHNLTEVINYLPQLNDEL